MTILYVNTGSSPNRGDGDSLRTSFNKINQNFAQLSTSTGNLEIIDHAIYGTQIDSNISILPSGTGSVVVSSLTTPLLTTPSLTISEANTSSTTYVGFVYYEQHRASSVVPGTYLPAGVYGIPYAIPAPYYVFSVTGDSSTIEKISVGDLCSGADIKTFPVLARGTGSFQNYIVLDISSYQVGDEQSSMGTEIHVTRPLTRSFTKFVASTGTGIILDCANTELQVRGSIIPFEENPFQSLGMPTRPWSDIWVGIGGVNIKDEADSRDVKISANNGNLKLGKSGISVGSLILSDDYISATTSTKFLVGTNTEILSISENGISLSSGTTITFGDGTIQTTAYTGSNGTSTNIDLSAVGQSIIPSTNLTYDLGSTSSQWRSLYVGTSTIYLGGIPLSVSTSGELVVNGNPVASTVQPYLELTNAPFIIQPVAEGLPVTVTAPPQGNSAQVEVVIGEGPVIISITVTNPGTGYVVGQRYRIWSYYIGGPDDVSSIDFEVETVGGNGELLTIIDAAFVGAASNTPGTYSNAGLDYRASVFDEIDTNLVLTRDRIQGLYNIVLESEYDNNNYTSPLGTEWNADGWDNLVGFGRRSYTTFRAALGNQVGNNIIGAELIMHDIANDRYYKFSFTQWGQNNGAYSYTRTEITDPNFFEKKNNGDEIDIFVEDDGEGSGIGITRDTNQGIYNPYRDEGWDSDFTPSGTEWNTDGWDDLSDIATRTYTNFYAAYGNGQLGNRVPGSKAILYIPDTGKYYAVQWINWTQDAGGGFSYLRYELDLTKLNEGVKFADGTVQKTAYIPTTVKSTASGERRIEEAVGSNTVSVTGVITNSITASASRSVVDDNRFWVSNTATNIAAIMNNTNAFGIQDQSSIQFSLDNSTWYTYNNGYSGTSTEIGVDAIGGPFTYNEGDTIYFRYNSGGAPVVWWDKNDLPGGSGYFRGAVIDYHAFTGDATFIGTIHIVDDDGEENITHTEVSSGGTDSENDDLWLVQNEGTISYRRIDGASATLKIHWTARVFYGSEIYD